MAKEDHGYEVEAMLKLEAETMGRSVALIDVRGLSTVDGRIWTLIYDASSERQEQRRVAVYRQLGDEYTALFSGILHVATKGPRYES